MASRGLLGRSTRDMRLGFGLAAALFLALVALAMAFLLQANLDFGRMAVEHQAAQAASVLQAWMGSLERMMAYQSGTGDPASLAGDMPDVMEHVSGLAIFNRQGKRLFEWGEALPNPLDLQAGRIEASEQPFGDRVFWNQDGSVYYLKNLPGQQRLRQMFPMMSNRRARVAPQGQGDGNQEGMAAMGLVAGLPAGPLLLRFDGSVQLAGMYLRQSLILVLGGAAIALLGGMGWLFLRMQRLQANLDEQRALARLGTAARTLAHEVRNPLSIIITQKSLLERQLPEEYRPALESIGDEAKRIEFQIRQVKLVLGSEGNEPGDRGNAAGGAGPVPSAGGKSQAPADLAGDYKGPLAFLGSPEPWLRDLVASLPAWQGRVEVRQLPAGRPWLPWRIGGRAAAGGTAPSLPDRLSPTLSGEALRSVVANLVDNALEAYAARGAATGPVLVGWRVEGGKTPGSAMLRLEVEDQAGGVPRPLRQRMFDPFFTTKPHGSGVGLNLARELVRAAGGDIIYRRARPAGSRFIVKLPLDQRDAPKEGRT